MQQKSGVARWGVKTQHNAADAEVGGLNLPAHFPSRHASKGMALLLCAGVSGTGCTLGLPNANFGILAPDDDDDISGDDDDDATTSNPTALTEGMLIISEFMAIPTYNGDEWIELYNPGSDPLVIDELRLADSGGESVLIEVNTTLDPMSYLVLVRDGCGVPGISYNGDFRLDDHVDEIRLISGTTLIDEVRYDRSFGWDIGARASLGLSPSTMAADANNDPEVWCLQGRPLEITGQSNSSWGTPGASNDGC